MYYIGDINVVGVIVWLVVIVLPIFLAFKFLTKRGWIIAGGLLLIGGLFVWNNTYTPMCNEYYPHQLTCEPRPGCMGYRYGGFPYPQVLDAAGPVLCIGWVLR